MRVPFNIIRYSLLFQLIHCILEYYEKKAIANFNISCYWRPMDLKSQNKMAFAGTFQKYILYILDEKAAS